MVLNFDSLVTRVLHLAVRQEYGGQLHVSSATSVSLDGIPSEMHGWTKGGEEIQRDVCLIGCDGAAHGLTRSPRQICVKVRFGVFLRVEIHWPWLLHVCFEDRCPQRWLALPRGQVEPVVCLRGGSVDGSQYFANTLPAATLRHHLRPRSHNSSIE
jgi:hypothetical protein